MSKKQSRDPSQNTRLSQNSERSLHFLFISHCLLPLLASLSITLLAFVFLLYCGYFISLACFSSFHSPFALLSTLFSPPPHLLPISVSLPRSMVPSPTSLSYYSFLPQSWSLLLPTILKLHIFLNFMYYAVKH